jgi:hypothetical protein
MSKFYAAAGNRSLVIAAENAAEAATKFIDHVLGDHVWIYDEPTMTEADRRAHLAIEAWLKMDAVVVISELGAGRDDAGRFDTAELVDAWHRLMVATAKMFSQTVND